MGTEEHATKKNESTKKSKRKSENTLEQIKIKTQPSKIYEKQHQQF